MIEMKIAKAVTNGTAMPLSRPACDPSVVGDGSEAWSPSKKPGDKGPDDGENTSSLQ